MASHGYLADAELLALSHQVAASRDRLHTLDFFKRRRPASPPDELEVLRRWNSHTPMLYTELGGGFFLRWRGRGIVIDPGCTFIDIFRRDHPTVGLGAHCMDDIDLIIVSHDHVDHSGDLSSLLTLLRAFNRWREEEAARLRTAFQPRKVDLVLSLGVYYKCQTLLEHPDYRSLLRTCKVLPPRHISDAVDRINLEADYGFKLECLKTRHREIMGESTGFGIKLTLKNGWDSFVLCDSGDTAYEEEVAGQFEASDLLILHVGTLEKLPDQSAGRGEHLCFGGVVKTLRQLKRPPKLVMLSEWGQEFCYPGLRKRFTELIRRYAPGSTVVLPSDLGMRVSIPNCHIRCTGGAYAPAGQVQVRDNGTWLSYLNS
ncbi:MAG: MBL fold metallo-hydrolase [Verrucomicrobia bacterium]|nr:MBL fold metallo-hydrolase [Verrucomicrobiota bacterium]